MTVSLSQPASRRNVLIAVAVVVVIAAIGLAYLATKAANNLASLEPESATLAGGVMSGTDINASGGKYVQFSAGTTTTPPPSNGGSTANLDDPRKKEVAMMLVSSAENSSLDWRAQYAYIEYNVEGNADENRGYTGGIIGFTSATHDMLEMVQYYNTIAPNNVLSKYIPALQRVDGTSSQAGLGSAFTSAWAQAANDPKFVEAQNHERDRVYFNPAVSQAKADGLHALGQFDYYDAIVVHGEGDDKYSFGGIRKSAMAKAKTPAQGGDEKAYLNAWMEARITAMQSEEAHSDVTRIDTAQRVFLNAGNLNLNLPLSWKVYGDSFSLTEAQLTNYINTGRF
jgi:chitosanase